MYCTNCGAQVEDNARFCTNCGAKMEPAPAPAPAQEPAQPTYTQPAQQAYQPDPNYKQSAAYNAAVAYTQKNTAGKYILKRLIFFGAALVIWLVAAIILGNAVQGTMPSDPARNVSAASRILQTLMLVIGPFVLAFVIGMLSGLAKNQTAKNVFRIIAAVFRSLTPFVNGILLTAIFAIGLGLLPLFGANSPASYILPFLTLLIPLTGYTINAAQVNGRPDGFAGSVGAVAAWSAEKMPLIVFAVLITESMYSIPGLGALGMQAYSAYNFSVLSAALINITIITCILRLLMDIIAALCLKGDPSSQVFARVEKTDHSGRTLLVIGLIAAGVMILIAAVVPFLSSGEPSATNMNDLFRRPGEGGYILGTDQMGRDVFSQLTLGLRNTVISALTNTIIAVILGAVFGMLSGFIRGKAAEVFNGLAYVFGHGTGIALIIGLFLISSRIGLGINGIGFVAVGLFGWGGIAGRVSNAIKAKKGPRRAVITVPILEQIVRTFCSAIIWITGLSYLGLFGMIPTFPTLGSMIAAGRYFVTQAAHLYLWPAAAFILLLLAFYLLHAGLCARERYSGKR